MILIDTSVWIDHFRGSNAALRDTLAEGRGGLHAFVIGELALGNLRHRDEVLGLLQVLPRLPTARDEDVRQLVELQGLAGSGIGWVDAHLLCSARINRWRVMTLDGRLARAAARLGVAA